MQSPPDQRGRLLLLTDMRTGWSCTDTRALPAASQQHPDEQGSVSPLTFQHRWCFSSTSLEMMSSRVNESDPHGCSDGSSLRVCGYGEFDGLVEDGINILFFSATQVSPSEVQDIFQETTSNIVQINSNGKEPLARLLNIFYTNAENNVADDSGASVQT